MKAETPNAKTQLGGVCGQNSGTGVITNCIVSGNIESKLLCGLTAGIAPYSSGSVQNCGNYSNVHMELASEGEFNRTETEVDSGGVIGSGLSVVDSCNYGSITISGVNSNGLNIYTGGVAGAMQKSKITGCYNIGKVESLIYAGDGVDQCTGGIVGIAYNCTTRDCYNIGEVTDNYTIKVGAIIGRTNGSYSNLYYISNSAIKRCWK